MKKSCMIMAALSVVFASSAMANQFHDAMEAQRWQMLKVSVCKEPTFANGQLIEGIGMREANQLSAQLMGQSRAAQGCDQFNLYPVCNLPQAGVPERCAPKRRGVL
jgi:hypothetical protein